LDSASPNGDQKNTHPKPLTSVFTVSSVVQSTALFRLSARHHRFGLEKKGAGTNPNLGHLWRI